MFPLHRHDARFLCAILAAACVALAVRADVLPLPAAEQEQVNKAIDRGVAWLKRAQLQAGTWPQRDNKHVIGYTALPALTLLECGVPANDPVIVRAARLVRRSAANLDATYEISLSILFLDRLGDPADRKLIQSLALRLVAGQSPTGGWGYKVPVLTPRQSETLITALRMTEPETLPLELVMSKPRDPGQTKPSDLNTTPNTGDKSRPSELKPADPKSVDSKIDPSSSIEMPRDESRLSPRSGGCLKYLDDAIPVKTAPKPTPRKYVVPKELRDLVVFQDFKKLAMADPTGRAGKLILCTTDNSNSQFATLAVWAARRHDVPLTRTLALIGRRFETSQNPNGSWFYHYRYGGTAEERPTMTAVGLIGLAVGHGISDTERDAVLRDPRISKGLAALARNIGEPVGRTRNIPQENLYFLWSVERVGMLHNLQKIGDKDWYRWGAEMLVANQAGVGNWDNGKYHAAHPTIDTCLALLFLKRANLARDLTERLVAVNPIQPTVELVAKPAQDEKKEPKPAERPVIVTPPAPVIEAKHDGSGVTPSLPDGRPSNGSSAVPDVPKEPPPRSLAWVYALIVLGLLVLAGGIAFITIQLRSKPTEATDSAGSE
jgi:hypothetical protein